MLYSWSCRLHTGIVESLKYKSWFLVPGLVPGSCLIPPGSFSCFSTWLLLLTLDSWHRFLSPHGHCEYTLVPWLRLTGNPSLLHHPDWDCLTLIPPWCHPMVCTLTLIKVSCWALVCRPTHMHHNLEKAKVSCLTVFMLLYFTYFYDKSFIFFPATIEIYHRTGKCMMDAL